MCEAEAFNVLAVTAANVHEDSAVRFQVEEELLCRVGFGQFHPVLGVDLHGLLEAVHVMRVAGGVLHVGDFLAGDMSRVAAEHAGGVHVVRAGEVGG